MIPEGSVEIGGEIICSLLNSKGYKDSDCPHRGNQGLVARYCLQCSNCGPVGIR